MKEEQDFKYINVRVDSELKKTLSDYLKKVGVSTNYAFVNIAKALVNGDIEISTTIKKNHSKR